jgi:Rrf2 family transcriptional regulator, iron-sulfur cluster assembly transcription factor
MVFSKSFGYALRGVLYVAFVNKTRKRVLLDEIARDLGIPRHFLGKIMKRMAKENIISSVKGRGGGFCVNGKTLHTKLTRIMAVTGETSQFENCVLQAHKCNATNPCPLHKEANLLKKNWHDFMETTTIADLMKNPGKNFISSMAGQQSQFTNY